MRAALALLALVLGSVAGADATTLLDYITFDGIDYIRFADEPGRPLTRADLGPEFDVVALVEMIATGAVRPPKVHGVAEPRYWLTLWLTDGTTLGRIYFAETREVMGGVSVPAEFARILERYLGPRSD